MVAARWARWRQRGCDRGRAAFTLIELLIVVAIIAVLAAIAVPNFLEAQTRAKVSRVRSDMRALKTAIDSYAIDNRVYPFAQSFSSPTPYQKLRQITTPIAYISGIPRDVFARRDNIFSQFIVGEPTNTYLYNTGAADAGLGGSQSMVHKLSWSLTGSGPDTDFQFIYYAFDRRFVEPEKRYVLWIYDPTNGTVSTGDMFTRGGLQTPPLPEIE